MYRNERLCCSAPKQATLTLLTKMIVLSDLLMVAFWFWASLILLLGTAKKLAPDYYYPFVSSPELVTE